MKAKKIVFFGIIAALIAYAVLVDIYFVQINNYLVLNPILFVKNISFTTVILALSIIVFSLITTFLYKNFSQVIKKSLLSLLFFVVNFFLIKAMSYSDDMGIIALFIGFIIFPIFLILCYFVYNKIFKKENDGIVAFLIFILILQMVFGFFAALGKDGQWTENFGNYYINKAIASRDIKACEKLDDIPVMGIKVDSFYHRSAGKCYADYFRVNPATLSGCLKLDEKGNYYKSDCINGIASEADLFSQGSGICDIVQTNADFCYRRAAAYYHDMSICKKIKPYENDSPNYNPSGYENYCVQWYLVLDKNQTISNDMLNSICNNLRDNDLDSQKKCLERYK